MRRALLTSYLFLACLLAVVPLAAGEGATPSTPPPLTAEERLELMSLLRDFEAARAQALEAKAALSAAADKAVEVDESVQSIVGRLVTKYKAQGYNLHRDTLQWVKAELPSGAQQENADAADGPQPVEPAVP